MNEQEVRTYIATRLKSGVCTEEDWKHFLKYMTGQTVGVNKDGSTDYYECDVERYFRKPLTRQQI